MIIDFHTHVFPPFFRNDRDLFFPDEPAFDLLYNSPESRLAGITDLLANMDDQGIDRSVIFGFPWKKADYFRRHNDYIIESVNKHRERLIGFCCFDPSSGQALDEVVRCLECGLAGVGELALYDSGLSPKMIRSLSGIMDICSQHDVPLLFHTTEPVGHQYAGKQPLIFIQTYDLIKAYPSNRIVLSHWGGGLFFYGLMKKEVRDVLRNVWFDTAASPFLYVPDIYRVAGEIVGHERILFGSDYPLLGPDRYFREMESAGLSRQSIRKISGENAARLLKSL